MIETGYLITTSINNQDWLISVWSYMCFLLVTRSIFVMNHSSISPPGISSKKKFLLVWFSLLCVTWTFCFKYIKLHTTRFKYIIMASTSCFSGLSSPTKWVLQILKLFPKIKTGKKRFWGEVFLKCLVNYLVEVNETTVISFVSLLIFSIIR